MSKLFPYLGGKRLLAKTIVALLPEHRLYCEAFGGSATVLLAKPQSHMEVLNDLNREITNLFRIVKCHHEAFIEELRWIVRSRDDFQRHRDTPPGSLTDLQRAARYYYLVKAAYSGKVPEAKSHFTGKQGGASHPMSIYQVEASLQEVHYRLRQVSIECLPYGDCLRRYDGPESLFYLDPPYYGHEKDYGPNIFSREDFAGLADLLRGLAGKFLLSLNDTPEVRGLFGDFHSLEVNTTYFAGTRQARPKPARELLIANYPLPQKGD